MGRNSTGAYATSEVHRIELGSLFKLGFLKEGGTTRGNYSWDRNGTPAGHITIEGNLDLLSIRLIYTLTDNGSGEKVDRDYKVSLIARPSNLGKGQVYFFLCPYSGRPCRILYSAYFSPYFKCKAAYKTPLFYDSQMSSRLDKANDDFWRLERALMKRPRQRKAYNYAGKPTRRYLKQQRDFQRLEELDNERWSQSSMPKRLWATFHAERNLAG